MSAARPGKKRRRATARRTRGSAPTAHQTAWSARWMKAVAAFTPPAALERGRRLAASGNVLSLWVDEGFAEALVQGARAQPYKVEIGLPLLSAAQARRAVETLTKEAYIAAKLLAGELPPEVPALLARAGVPLFPVSAEDISGDCSGPRDAAPCPHLTAAYVRLGDAFDRDPFLLLEMRGLARAQVLAGLPGRHSSGRRGAQEPGLPPPSAPPRTPLSAHLNDFFDAPKPVAWERPAGALDPLPSPGARLRELGAPPFWQSDVDFQTVLAAMYGAVRKKIYASLPSG